MKEEFTEEEKKQAERLVNQIADDGKFERECKKVNETLQAMVDANREGNASILIVYNESLGRSILSLGGKGINIITTLVAVCEEDEKFKELFMHAASYLAKEGLKDMLRKHLDD